MCRPRIYSAMGLCYAPASRDSPTHKELARIMSCRRYEFAEQSPPIARELACAPFIHCLLAWTSSFGWESVGKENGTKREAPIDRQTGAARQRRAPETESSLKSLMSLSRSFVPDITHGLI